jgi:predicted DNA-binding transcriptional regulator YafY
VAWCRLRAAIRVFRTDRIAAATVTAEVPRPRALHTEDLDIPRGLVHQLALG